MPTGLPDAPKRHPADDPNTSPERLAALLVSHPDQVLANPVFPLLFLENPGWLESALEYGALVKVLNLPQLPCDVVEHFTQSAHTKLRAVAQMHVCLGEAQPGWEAEVVARLAALSCTRDDQRQLLENGLIPEWLLPHLRTLLTPRPRSPKPRPLTDSELAQTMAPRSFKNPTSPVVPVVWKFWSAGAGVRAWGSSERGVLQSVTANPSTPSSVLARIVEAIAAQYAHAHPTILTSHLANLRWHPNVDESLARHLHETYHLSVPRFLPLPVVLGRDDTLLWLKGEAVMGNSAH